MKTKLLLLSLLCFGQSVWASKFDHLVETIEQEFDFKTCTGDKEKDDAENYMITFLGTHAYDYCFDAPHDLKVTVLGKKMPMADFFRTLKDNLVQRKYFCRGGNPALLEKLQQVIKGYDLPLIAQAFQDDPLLATCINPFEVMIGKKDTFAENVDIDCAKGNVDAQKIKNAYPRGLWDVYHWERDEKILMNVHADQKALDSEDLFVTLKARKNDPQATVLIEEIKKHVSLVSCQASSTIATFSDDEVKTYHTWLRNIKYFAELELDSRASAFSLDDYINQFKTRLDELDAQEKDKKSLSTCFTSGELTDEGEKILKAHKTNPKLTPVITNIQKNFGKDIITKELAGASTLASIARLEKWLKAFTDAGIVLDNVDINDTQSKLTTRKDALNKKPDLNPPHNPKDTKQNNASKKSWITNENMAFCIGFCIVSYMLYYKTQQSQTYAHKNDKSSKTA